MIWYKRFNLLTLPGCIILVSLSIHAQTRYVAVPIPTIPSSSAEGIQMINNVGDITGYYKDNNGIYHPFVFANFNPINLGGFSLSSIFPFDINDSMQIVGSISNDDATADAFIWSNGTLTQIGPLPGGTSTHAIAINNNGVVLGTGTVTNNPSGTIHTFLYNNGSIQDIGSPANSSIGTALNDFSQVVGMTDYSNINTGTIGPLKAFLWNNGVFQDLGDLSGGLGTSNALSINNHGQIVGFSDLASGSTRHAFIYQNGVMTDIGALGTGPTAEAVSINDLGQIVGDSWTNPIGRLAAFLWEKGQMKDLSSRIEPTAKSVTTFNAYGATSYNFVNTVTKINNLGEIVVTQSNGILSTPSFILTPVTPGKIVNFSMRGAVGQNGPGIVLGYVVSGADTKLLLRGAGPSLAGLGITAFSTDPELSLFSGQTLTDSNDNWGASTNAISIGAVSQQVGAFPFLSGSKDAALLETASPGAYSCWVSAASGTPGVALGEIYDADSSTASGRIINASALVQAGTGEQTAIAGFVIAGNYGDSILIRAVGSGLGQFGLTGLLNNPQIALCDSSGNVQASTGAWNGDPLYAQVSTQVGAFPVSASSGDAMLIASVKPGAYTVHVTGGNTGWVLLEIYELQ